MDAFEIANRAGMTMQAAKQAALADGHQLIGSVAQITWARTIRAQVAGELAVKALGVKPEMSVTYVALVTSILSETSATAWIDSRNTDTDSRIRAAMARA